MISKEKFVKIINRLKDTDKKVNEANKILRSTIDGEESDYMNVSALSISHEFIVIELLENIFGIEDDELLTWWIYDLNYGTEFKIGDLSYEENGKTIKPDLSTPEKLYDYLINDNH